MLDIIIIGGGVHGAVLALRLINENIVSPDKLVVLDPHEQPMAEFRTRTAATGMEYLRSPGSHSLSADKTDLLKWGRIWERGKNTAAFYGLQRRPSTELFFAHSDKLLSASKIESRYCKGHARQIHRVSNSIYGLRSKERSFWRVESDRGNLDARIVILAPGARETPFYPDWAHGMIVENSVEHVFAPGFRLDDAAAQTNIAIIGGGISAHQLALHLSLCRNGPQVTLIKRANTSIHAYDSDPGYLGVKNGRDFAALKDYAARRKTIDAARWPGSIPKDLAEHLADRLANANADINDSRRTNQGLKLIHGSVVAAYPLSSAEMAGAADADLTKATITANKRTTPRIHLDITGGRSGNFDKVILATGFVNNLPQRNWIRSSAASESLKTHIDGYPIPSPSLEWAPRLFVSGGLAELEMGPSCLNIIGAQKTYEKMRPKIHEELENSLE